MKKLLLLAGLLTLVLAEVHAQDVTSNVAAKIGAVTELSASAGKDAAVFNFTTAAQLTSGITTEEAVFTLTAKSNKPYYVSVSAAAANFSGGSADGPLPVGKLSVSINGTAFVTVGTTPAKLIGVSANESRGSADYPIYYKLVPGLEVAPAQDYTTTLTYTITAP